MSQEKGRYHLVGTVAEFAEKKMILKQVMTKRVTVAMVGDDFFAFEDSCPHQGESLSKGKLADCIVTCPAHNWKFNIKTGESTVVPDEFIYTFPVLIEDEKVFVKI